MVKTILIGICFLFVVSGSVFAESEIDRFSSLKSCIDVFQSKLEQGYKSIAFATDGPYFICGYSWAALNKKYATELALHSCEQARRSPAASVNGERTVMTHCRIYATEFVE